MAKIPFTCGFQVRKHSALSPDAQRPKSEASTCGSLLVIDEIVVNLSNGGALCLTLEGGSYSRARRPMHDSIDRSRTFQVSECPRFAPITQPILQTRISNRRRCCWKVCAGEALPRAFARGWG